jgi:glycosyltransferase involved in cell wall biosynthesis
VTHSIGERLVEDYGHDVHVLAVNFRGDAWPCERPGHDHPTPLRLYRPDIVKSGDIHGFSRVFEIMAKVEPDVIVMLNDPQVALHFLLGNKEFDPVDLLLRYRPILYYVPVDGTNMPPRWYSVLPKITNVVAMSRHGQQYFKPSKLVYHGIDTDLWWPIWEKPKVTTTGIEIKDSGDAKEAFGFPRDCFLVGRVDTNSGRKDYAALVKALWPFMERHPETRAHFHCEDQGPTAGLRFQAMLSRYNHKVDSMRFHFPGLHTSFEGWAQQDLNVLYSAFDIFVSTSRGEGFGLTLLEAAACGIPIIAQDVSAIPEVVGPGGILLKPRDLLTTPAGQDNWLPDIPAFSAAIEKLYRSPERRRSLGEAGAAHAKTLSWDFAARKFDEYITELGNYKPPASTDTSEDSDA